MMEALGLGLQAIGRGIAACATAFGFIGVITVLVSGILLYCDKITPDDLKKLLRRKNGL